MYAKNTKNPTYEYDEFCSRPSTGHFFTLEELTMAEKWSKKTNRDPFFYLTMYLLAKKDKSRVDKLVDFSGRNSDEQDYRNLERRITQIVKGEIPIPVLELEPLNRDLFLQMNQIQLKEESFELNSTSENVNVLRKNIREKYHEFLMQRSGNYDITTSNLTSQWPKYLGSFNIKERMYYYPLIGTPIMDILKEGTVLDFKSETIRGDIERRKAYSSFKISPYYLQSHIGKDGNILFFLNHKHHEIWSFLTDFDFVRPIPIIEAIHQYPNPIPIIFVVVRVEVWLTSNVVHNTLDLKVRQYGRANQRGNAEAKEESDSSDSDEENSMKKKKVQKENKMKDFADDPEELSDDELIFREKCKGVRESLIILFDLLRVKKTIYPMVFLKQKTPYFEALRRKHQYHRHYDFNLTNFKKEITGNAEIDNAAELFSKYYLKERAEIEHELARQGALRNRPLQADSLYDESIKLLGEDESKLDYNELLKVTDSNNFKIFENPPGMRTQLFDYQRQGLSWILYREGYLKEKEMLIQEAKNERKLSPMWEEVLLLDGTLLYFNNFTGGMSTEFKKIKESPGGVLADEMGLGKTLMIIAAILVNRPAFRKLDKFDSSDDDSDEEFNMENEIKRRRSSKAFQSILQKYSSGGKNSEKNSEKKAEAGEKKAGTLIVVPKTVLDQWKSEIEKHSKTGAISVHKYYDKGSRQSNLDNYDVVLTTYDIMSQEYHTKEGRLFAYHWYRLVLDEAHNVKGRQTRRAKAACSIGSDIRWCLTGTPIQNKLDDMFSLVSFLRIDTFSEYYFWNQYINKALTSLEGFEVLHQVLQSILLRRTKNSTYKGGETILKLPPKNLETCLVEFSAEERKIYDILHEKSRRDVKGMITKGTLLKNYSHVFSLLIRLRQLCDHARIIFKEDELATEVSMHRAVNGLLRIMDSEPARKDCHQDPAYYRKVLQEIKNGNHANCPSCEDPMDDLVLTSCGCVICNKCALQYVIRDQVCAKCRSRLQSSELKAIDTDELCIDFDKYKQSSKTKAIMERVKIVRQKREKCVIFSQFKPMIKFIGEELHENQIRFCVLEGSLSQKKRANVLESFINNDAYTVLIASLMVGAVGLNLVVANHVFIVDPWWNPAIEDQAIERVYRIGQKKEVNVVRFVCKNSIEERIIELHKQKKDLIENAIVLNPEERKMRNLERVRYLLE